MFERRFGVKTSYRIPGEDLGHTDERFLHYEPAGWRTLQQALPKRSVSAEDVFIDLGSGMGRTVLRAAEYPFKRVIGVELSPALHAIAVENVERCRPRRRCGEVELVCADVLAFDFPDDVTVVFLYNPFRSEIFDEAMAALFRSVARNPRRVRILYRNPVEHRRLLDTGRVRVLDEWKSSIWRGWPRKVTGFTYEVLPPAPRA
ncbi:MAG TPA: class I SAM-dependent methyltransferase [Solirubrobacterales bacterium]|nr:class I SAM-dependent methyltransferase [Solirubrobacterales bacterium]